MVETAKGAAVPVEGSFDPSGLELTGRGLRFVRGTTEREYRLWHAQAALPQARTAFLANIISWTLLLIGWTLTGLPSFGAAVGCAAMAMTVSVARLMLVRRTGMLAWVLPSSAGSAAVSAALLIGLSWFVADLPELALVVVLTWIFLLSAILRLRTGLAISTILPIALVDEVLLVRATQLGRLGTTGAVFHTLFVIVVLAIGLAACVASDRSSRQRFRQERIIEEQGRIIEDQRDRADRLLLSILPATIAERLKASPGIIADRVDEVTVVFIDVVGFTSLAATMTPETLVELLDGIFTRFDALALRFGVEKIKTIGDAYMAVSGLPVPRRDHAQAAAEFALAARTALAELAALGRHAIQVRIGMSTGPVVAGVIGAHKFAYDLWGDTVNTAARMESHGVPGQVQISEATFRELRDCYRLEERGVIEVKGKGPMSAWLLIGSNEGAQPPASSVTSTTSAPTRAPRTGGG